MFVILKGVFSYLRCAQSRINTVPAEAENLSNGNEVLGCFGQLGLQRKKTPNCHKYATIWMVFSTFCGQKKIQIFSKNILASALKSHIA